MARIRSTSTVVCDAGPAIHLDELGCLDLLKDFHEILLSDTICEEIDRYRPLALKRTDLPFVRRSGKAPSDDLLLTHCKVFSLDAGEMEALSLMEKNPDAIFLTDDAAARLVAVQMGYDVHGTIGVLIRSIRRGLNAPEEVLEILRDIPLRTTLYLRHSLLDEIQLKVKSEFNL